MGINPEKYKFRGASDTDELNLLKASGFLYLWPEHIERTFESMKNIVQGEGTYEGMLMDCVCRVIVHEAGHCFGLCHTFSHHTLGKRCFFRYQQDYMTAWSDLQAIDIGSAMMYSALEIGVLPPVLKWIEEREERFGMRAIDIGHKPCFSTTDIRYLRSIYWPDEDPSTHPIPELTIWGDRRPGDEWVLTATELCRVEALVETEKNAQANITYDPNAHLGHDATNETDIDGAIRKLETERKLMSDVISKMLKDAGYDYTPQIDEAIQQQSQREEEIRHQLDVLRAKKANGRGEKKKKDMSSKITLIPTPTAIKSSLKCSRHTQYQAPSTARTTEEQIRELQAELDEINSELEKKGTLQMKLNENSEDYEKVEEEVEALDMKILEIVKVLSVLQGGDE